MDNNLQTSGEITTGDQRPAVVAPMAPEVLEALRGSIKKWEGIVAGTTRDEGGRNCPLCQMFVHGKAATCRGCPVRTRTGKSSCDGTPYYYYEHGDTQTAQAELDFLKSLLPESAS